MTKVATTLRCVPRYGYEYTEVRMVTLDLPRDLEEHHIHQHLDRWFAQRGLEQAVFGIDLDDEGPFAIINDEAFIEDWGKPVGL